MTLSYADIDNDLLDALRAVEGGCAAWIEGDPRINKLHEIDENLLHFREVRSNEYEVTLGSSGRAYLAGLARGSSSTRL
jgi:hypothetical protein